MSQTPPMAEHPDIAEIGRAHDMSEIRERYERASERPIGQIVEGLIMLAGLYVALSPWIVGFTGPLQVNNLIVGLTVAALGFGFAAAYGSTHRLAWVCPVLGIWTIVALWAVSDVTRTTGSIVSNVFAGAVVLLFGLAMLAMGAGRISRTRGGGR